ncbi:hypothetical protein [Pseudoalteromonas denitrificans]|uniref:Uncharacterized protein n=1 Tax=Pseudoalteromonas denitrificans DSM 6059 TaxID=1123010 RepID=A0A1I1U833_9GAMM|nr:hypothetical protein [Pseudoalteromonas denitrificans]SFD64883.1 hypothetical protein SAMN02745724_05083 [Pseudoalteromonas denitrificans DSM 6059]
MKSTWFVFLFLTSHVLSFNATAMGNITYLNVIDEVVYFSTDKIKPSTPSCAITASAEQWTVSLNNRTGRALYALLVTAMAAKQAISIESSGDCNDIDGIERARGISLVKPNETELTGGKSLYLFKGDGVTKIGRIAQVLSETKSYYLPFDGGSNFKVFDSTSPILPKLASPLQIYYDGFNCTGTPYISGISSNEWAGFNKFYKQGAYLRKGALLTVRIESHMSSHYGTCTKENPNGGASWQMYKIIEASDPFCGSRACIIKEG